MNTRFKELRQTLNLNQDEFGKRINISGPSVSRIENGTNNPSSQTIALVCAEYGVSKRWLVDGKGDMFHAQAPNEIDILDIMQKYKFPDIVENLLTAYNSLDEYEQEAVLEYSRRFIASFVNPVDSRRAIDAKVEAYRAELEAQERIRTSYHSRITSDEKAGTK